MANIKSFYEPKLAESGITPEQGKLLQIRFIKYDKAVQLDKHTLKPGSIQINYIHPITSEPAVDQFVLKPYFRLRRATIGSFGQKQAKYWQPPYTSPVAYWPCVIDWKEVFADPSQPIIVTEGEFKAAKLCLEGFPAVGLGGVWNFRSYERGIIFIKSLQYPELNWHSRRVYIVFDSDITENTSVAKAAAALAEDLTERGAITYLTFLSDIENLSKTGVDDFLVHCGVDKFRDLLAESEHVGLGEAFWNINKKWCYVPNPGLMVNLQNMSHKVSPNAWTQHVMASRKYLDPSP